MQVQYSTQYSTVQGGRPPPARGGGSSCRYSTVHSTVQYRVAVPLLPGGRLIMQVQYSTQYTVQYSTGWPCPSCRGGGSSCRYSTVHSTQYSTVQGGRAPPAGGEAHHAGTVQYTVHSTVQYRVAVPLLPGGRLIMQVQYSTQYT